MSVSSWEFSVSVDSYLITVASVVMFCTAATCHGLRMHLAFLVFLLAKWLLYLLPWGCLGKIPVEFRTPVSCISEPGVPRWIV